jgi:hypothetical protein
VRKIMLPSVSVSRFVRTALISGALVCAALFSPNADLFVQARAVSNDFDIATGFDETALNYSYTGSYDRIEDVDFRNLTMYLFEDDEKPEAEYALRDGQYDSRRDPDYHDVGIYTVSLDDVHRLLGEEPDRRYAIAVYTWLGVGGSSSQDGVVQVFELFQHRLTLRQQLRWDNQVETTKPHVWFSEDSKTLVVRSAHYLPHDSHCCVSAMDVVTLRWNGTRFVKTSVRTELSDYGIREGKKL